LTKIVEVFTGREPRQETGHSSVTVPFEFIFPMLVRLRIPAALVAKALMTTDHKRAAKLAHLLQSYFLFGQFCCDGEEAMEAVREVYL